MPGYTLKKEYRNHYGLDFKSSDLDRPDVFASDLLNAQYKADGSLEKRRGFKACGISTGGFGLFVYNRINPSTNKLVPELLSASNTISKLVTANLSVSYTGSASAVVVDLLLDSATSTYKFQILEDTTVVLDIDLGQGFDEASPVTLTSLSGSVSALTDYTGTVTGTGSTPAAFLDIVNDYDLLADDLSLDACDWQTVNSPLATPLSGSETNKNDSDFENISFAQLSNVTFISNGYDELQKYDGQNLYRAGIPAGVEPSTATAGAGSIPAGTYVYAAVYVQKDAVGNLVEGDISTTDSITLGGVEDVDVTVTNIEDTTGFNTNCAIVAGAQVSVTTITVDDGSGGAGTLKVGDTAYFFDAITGDYVEREVTAVTATDIDIAGAAVTVADNDVISNNLRIGIYRSVVGGSLLFLVDEIPNDSFSTTQVYTDSTLDSALGIQFIDPVFDRGLPPKGKYITTLYNQLAVAGNFDNPNTFFFSDITSPEHFPVAFNGKAQSENGDPISGVKQSNEVFCVFEKSAVHVISGDFTNLDVRQDIISHRIGCVAHATIQQVESRVYFLSEKGVYQIYSGQIPEERSERIRPVFDIDPSLADEQKFKTKRSLAVTDTIEERYILFVPTESTSAGSDVYTNDNYSMFVEDYQHGNDIAKVYLKWRFADTNPAGGIVIFDDMLYFVERRFSSFNNSVDHILYKELKNRDEFDYADNVSGVDFTYKTNWYSNGQPSVFKRWPRLKVFGISTTSGSENLLSIQTEADYVADVTRNDTSVDLASAGAGYGNNQYGNAPYGDNVQPNFKVKLNGKYKSMRILFSNSTVHQNIELTGWELEIATPYRLEIKE